MIKSYIIKLVHRTYLILTATLFSSKQKGKLACIFKIVSRSNNYTTLYLQSIAH